MGSVHLRNLLGSARARVQWLVRTRVEQAQAFVQSHGLTARCAPPSRLDLVLDDASVHAVVISSPTDVHEEAVQRCLKAGKAVFCEKPITAHLDSTAACYDLAQVHKTPLFCAFHRRFDPSFKQVRDQVRQGSLGPVKLIRCSSHDPQYPPISYVKSSGGITKDSTIHDLDMALWLSGSTPKVVQCQGQAFHPEVKAAGDFDLVVATVLMDSGAVVVVDNGRKSSQAYDQRLEVMCAKGGYRVENRATSLTLTLDSDSTCTAPCESGYVVRYSDAYRAEMEHFLDVLEGQTQLLVTREDTLAAMTLAEAVATAAKTAQPVYL